MHLEPARSVILKFGGAEAGAEVTGKHLSRVYRWMYPRDRGGTGGLIPLQDAQKLLAVAATRGVALRPDDFFPRSEPAA